jgi:sec-independent protein translocase protein TatB
MLPGMGGFEAVVIALLALVIVGPKDLPILMRRLARWVNKVRGMAAEFRMSFDELARQSELDELRREVEALRRGDPLQPVRAEFEPISRDIDAGLNGHDDAVYRAAVDEANGATAEDPYLPSFEPSAPEPTPPPAPTPAAATSEADAPAKPKRARRKPEPEPQPAPVGGSEA